MRPKPTIRAIKALYAASGGVCAFPGCDAPLVDRSSGAVLGDVCHIHAVSAGGPRHKSELTDEERGSPANLIALCPTHHRLVDAKPDEYSAELLIKMKQEHEARVASQVAAQKPSIQDRPAIDLSRQVQGEGSDFAIIVALTIELQAVLRVFPELRETGRPTGHGRTYYTGSVTTADGFQYRVVAMLLRSMGNLEAANATHDLITTWNPRYIIVTGIAGGLRPTDQDFGDIIVAQTVVYYEFGKEMDKGLESRNRQFPCDPSLLDAALNMPCTEWRDGLPSRPDNQPQSPEHPMVHYGPLASGEKVIASDDASGRLLRYQPDLVGVEMESAGVASAALGAVRKIGFLAIRSICDFADHKKNADWQGYAAETAATFVRAFLRNRPVGPSSGNWPVQRAFPDKLTHEDPLVQRKQLFNLLCRQLDMEEFKNLCFLLGVDIDEVPGDRKSARARELILRFERRGKLDDIASTLADMLNQEDGIG